jgi:diguanylate cyclase (GGDEF)-like protein
MTRQSLQQQFTRLTWQVMFIGVGACSLSYGIFQGLGNPQESGLVRVLLVMVWIFLARLLFRSQPTVGAGAALFGVVFALPFLIDGGVFNTTFAVLSIATLPSLLLTMLLGWRGAVLVAVSSIAVPFLKSSTSVEATVMGWVILCATAVCGALIHHLMRDIDQAKAQLEQTAMTDALTKLGNRFALDADFANHSGEGVLSMWDVNSLKQVNDKRGHLAGDAYLLEFVSAFQNESTDKLYRVGGDEFVGLHPAQTDLALLYVRVRGRFPDVSAGWAKLEQRDLDAVLRQADKAMYLEKGKRLLATSIGDTPRNQYS